ncbi:MAG: glycosyltransferase family 2 protein [Bacteroidetes bacterium]|nr:glycosyltransferase family 2 protein [Bacteroidota bacterium]MBL6963316.1 glycosyltransferase family 2 protein [Bacteroidota bacterium]
MNRQKSPLVSVLVLNYNGKRFLDDCFSTLLKSTYPHFEIIMIDNKSTDDSVAYTVEKYPEVEIFQNGVNGGFSLAYNNAFKFAKGKYFVVLNNDVKVDTGWIEPLVEEAEKDETIGALQPKLVSMAEPDKFEYAGASGGYMDKFGYPFTRGRIFETIEEDKGQYDDIQRCFWTTGAAMFVRADALKKSGDMDVDFVHHMEEIDLCYRINLAGYKLKVVPQSLVYHYGGGIISYDSYKKLYWNHRNSVFMLLKNLECKNLLYILPARIFLDVLTAAQSIVTFNFKRFGALCHAWFWLIFHPRMIIRKRREVKKRRTVPDADIFKLLYPKSIALQYFLKGKKVFSDLGHELTS